MISSVGSRKPTRLSLLLAGATIALAAAGPIWMIAGFPTSPSQVVAAILVCHTLASSLTGRGPQLPRIVLLYAVTSSLMFVGVFSADDTTAALAAFANFISGSLAALAIGADCLGEDRSRLNAIDLGLVIFVGWSAIQQAAGHQDVGSATELHSSILVAWGGSNYVGAVLVIAAFWLLARAIDVRRGAGLLAVSAVVAVVTAVSTLSRGAILAFAAGLLVIAWRAGRTRLSKVLWRSAVLVVPFVGFWLMDLVVGQRFVGTGADPASNIDARFTLYTLSWEMFLSSPVIGTGWAGLRGPTAQVFLTPVSFAHNWYLSALQIAGLFAVPMLVVFSMLVTRAVRHAGIYGAPVAAAFTAAMVEPVREGYVGSLMMVSVLVCATCAYTDSGRHRGRATMSRRRNHIVS